MAIKNPPFEINDTIVHSIADICELLGAVRESGHLTKNPILRRTNRIKTIYSSLAIEQNTLSLEQVTAIIDGKHILAPPKDIIEVQNAYEIYENSARINPCSVDDLLKAHAVMMRTLIPEAGQFRTKNVGVADASGRIIHMGTLPQYVPALTEKLLLWLSQTDVHPLISGCVFHYEFELIHPFADGNGRIGRLWHTLILSKWNSLFAWLPIESIIHNHQKEYYAAINASNVSANSTPFIEFMLTVIQEALTVALSFNHAPNQDALTREKQVMLFLRTHPHISNSDVRALFSVSIATANRLLTRLEKEGKLVRIRIGSFWGYRLP